MPRTMDNIGFYSRLGFVPGRLTVTTTLEAAHADHAPRTFGRLSPRDKDDVLVAARALLETVQPGFDYTREITLTDALALGDTVLLFDGDTLVGFALAHTASLVEGRTREELRVLKLALADETRFVDLVGLVCDFARRSGTRRVSFRMQGGFIDAYQRLIVLGGHVRWTDLRMSLLEFEERPPGRGM